MKQNYKYYQVLQEMIRRISDKEYLPNTMIPSALELMHEFNIGRNTAQRVLHELENKGMVKCSQGRRGIVTDNVLVDHFGKDRRITEFIKGNRNISSSHIVSKGLVKGPAKAVDHLGLESSQLLLNIYRIRFAKKLPVIINNTYFDPNAFSFLLESNLENISLNEHIRFETGLTPGREERELEITILTEMEANLLGLEVGSPALLLTQWVWDQYGRPFFFNRSLYHPYLVKIAYTIDH